MFFFLGILDWTLELRSIAGVCERSLTLARLFKKEMTGKIIHKADRNFNPWKEVQNLIDV
jgi:hypothetical protein